MKAFCKVGKVVSQGSVIELVLANLFLHYVFDRWMQIHYPQIPFDIFDFLGFTFRPRMSKVRKTGRLLAGFSPTISKKSFKKIRGTSRSWQLTGKVCKSIKALSSWLNPIIQGWINYYSKFNKTEFRKVMNYLNEKLIRWLRRKFKRLCNGYNRVYRKSKACAYFYSLKESNPVCPLGMWI